MIYALLLSFSERRYDNISTTTGCRLVAEVHETTAKIRIQVGGAMWWLSYGRHVRFDGLSTVERSYRVYLELQYQQFGRKI